MKKISNLKAIVFITLSFLTCIVLAQSAQDFKVTLSHDGSGDGCKWGGGTDGEGNVVVQAKTGAKKIQIKLEDTNGSMKFGTFNGPGSDQMKDSGGGKTINIHNKNTGPADVHYDIFITLDGDPKSYACHPKVINRT